MTDVCEKTGNVGIGIMFLGWFLTGLAEKSWISYKYLPFGVYVFIAGMLVIIYGLKFKCPDIGID